MIPLSGVGMAMLKSTKIPFRDWNSFDPDVWELIKGWNQLKSLSGIETRRDGCDGCDGLSWNQLKSLSGIETGDRLLCAARLGLKSTKIPFRDWNPQLSRVTTSLRSWNQLKSLSGIETSHEWLAPLQESPGLKSTKIPIRDWNPLNRQRWQRSLRVEIN